MSHRHQATARIKTVGGQFDNVGSGDLFAQIVHMLANCLEQRLHEWFRPEGCPPDRSTGGRRQPHRDARRHWRRESARRDEHSLRRVARKAGAKRSRARGGNLRFPGGPDALLTQGNLSQRHIVRDHYLLLFPFQLDFFGNFISSLLQTTSVHISWWIFSAALILFSTVLGVLGVKPSLRLGLIGLGFEMTILTIFSIIVIAHGGAHGNTIHAFDPSYSLKGSGGLLTAVVYTIFAFVGFESATTLGDEARTTAEAVRGRCSSPRWSSGSSTSWSPMPFAIGYGVSKTNAVNLATAAAPFNTLADHFGNGLLSLFVNLAVISSFTALNIVTVIAVSRIFWKMGRDGLLPSVLGRVNSRQSPHVAILVAGGLALVAALAFGAAYTPLPSHRGCRTSPRSSSSPRTSSSAWGSCATSGGTSARSSIG